MISESVGYRFSAAELSVLSSLLSIRELPGLNLPSEKEIYLSQTVSSLIEAGAISKLDKTLYVDQLISLLLCGMAASDCHIAIRSRSRSTLLYRTKIMYLLVDAPVRGLYCITPLAALDEASNALYQEISRHTFPVEAELYHTADALVHPLFESSSPEDMISFFRKQRSLFSSSVFAKE